MISKMERSAFQWRSILSFRSSSRLFSSACIFTSGENLVSTSSNSNSFSFSFPAFFSRLMLRYLISVQWLSLSSFIRFSQCLTAVVSSFSSYSSIMLECESYWLRSLRQGLFSSLTVGRKLGNLLINCSFQIDICALALGGVITALYLRLEVRDLEEPKFDFDERFLRYFIKLFIQLVCSYRIESIIDFRFRISSPLLTSTDSLLSSSFFSKLAELFKASFSLKIFISFSLYYASSSFKFFSAFRKSSSCSLNWLQQFSVSKSIFFFMVFSVSSCFFFSFSSSRLMPSIAMVFSSTSSFSFLSCFSMQSVDSLRELTMPLVRDFYNSRRLVRSFIYRSLSSSSWMIFLERLFISLAFMLSSRSQLAFRVEFQWSLTSNFELQVSMDALS